MGSAASTLDAIGSEHRTKRHKKDKFLPEVLELVDFDKICDANKTASIDDIVKPLSLKTDVFLTHNWGNNQDNHKRVALVNAGLKKRGLLTWFDDERMYVFILLSANRNPVLPCMILTIFSFNFCCVAGKVRLLIKWWKGLTILVASLSLSPPCMETRLAATIQTIIVRHLCCGDCFLSFPSYSF